jgi:hypothetical protein
MFIKAFIKDFGVVQLNDVTEIQLNTGVNNALWVVFKRESGESHRIKKTELVGFQVIEEE